MSGPLQGFTGWELAAADFEDVAARPWPRGRSGDRRRVGEGGFTAATCRRQKFGAGLLCRTSDAISLMAWGHVHPSQRPTVRRWLGCVVSALRGVLQAPETKVSGLRSVLQAPLFFVLRFCSVLQARLFFVFRFCSVLQAP